VVISVALSVHTHFRLARLRTYHCVERTDEMAKSSYAL